MAIEFVRGTWVLRGKTGQLLAQGTRAQMEALQQELRRQRQSRDWSDQLDDAAIEVFREMAQKIPHQGLQSPPEYWEKVKQARAEADAQDAEEDAKHAAEDPE